MAVGGTHNWPWASLTGLRRLRRGGAGMAERGAGREAAGLAGKRRGRGGGGGSAQRTVAARVERRGRGQGAGGSRN